MCMLGESQQLAGILAENLRLDGGRQVRQLLLEQLKLWHGLLGREKIGPEHDPILPADKEFAAKSQIPADRPRAAAGGKIAIQVRVLVHQGVDRAAGSD